MGAPGAPAARLGLGGAGVSACPGTCGSGAVRLGGPPLLALRRSPLAAGKSGCHHGEPLPLGAEPAPATHRVRTRATHRRVHTRVNAVGLERTCASLVVRALLTGRASVWEEELEAEDLERLQQRWAAQRGPRPVTQGTGTTV